MIISPQSLIHGELELHNGSLEVTMIGSLDVSKFLTNLQGVTGS